MPKGIKGFQKGHKSFSTQHRFSIGHKVNLGKRHSRETKEKISATKIARGQGGEGKYWPFRGERNPNWRGGITLDKKAYNKYLKAIRKEREGNPLTIKVIQLVYEDNIKKYGTLTCHYCLKQIDFGNDSLDHKTPLARGGSNTYENLTVACRNCNSRKWIRTEEEYKQIISK